jgi:hypothetical protein
VSTSGALPGPEAAAFSQGFNDATLAATGWSAANISQSASASLWSTTTGITSGGVPVVSPQEGARFAVVNFTQVSTGAGTINSWLFSPVINSMVNGDSFSFFTTTTPGSSYPDRLQVRLNTANTGTNVGATPTSVGDFTTLLLDINPAYDVGGYPEGWTQFTVNLSGLAGPTDGRLAFRYFVEDGGPVGANSNVIGLDTFVYTAAPIPEPATWAMALVGLAGLVGWRRARQDR